MPEGGEAAEGDSPSPALSQRQPEGQPGRRQAAPQQKEQLEGDSGGLSPEAPSYRIQWGDTLWRITERYYGDGDLYPLLAVENGIADPDVLIGGQDIRLPGKIDDQARIDNK